MIQTAPLVWSAGVWLTEALRGPGWYVTAPLWVPWEAQAIQLGVTNRPGWALMPVGEPVLSLAIEGDASGAWQRLARIEATATPQYADDGMLLTMSTVTARLPRVRAPQPQVRGVLTLSSACVCGVEGWWRG